MYFYSRIRKEEGRCLLRVSGGWGDGLVGVFSFSALTSAIGGMVRAEPYER